MTPMGYKVLGYIVWQVAKIVVRYKTPKGVTARNVGIAGLVGVGIVAALIVTRNSNDS